MVYDKETLLNSNLNLLGLLIYLKKIKMKHDFQYKKELALF